MVFEVPSESTLSSNECLDEDVDDPYSSLLSMNVPYDSTCMPNISDVKCLLDLQLGSIDSHLAFISCGSNLLIISVVLERRVSLCQIEVINKYVNIV
jgi:hypothetical protein